MTHRVTLKEAAEILSVPYETLKTWRKREQIHPAGIVFHPRRCAVYEIEELRAVAATATRRTSGEAKT